jgi:hypothetical protein
MRRWTTAAPRRADGVGIEPHRRLKLASAGTAETPGT